VSKKLDSQKSLKEKRKIDFSNLKKFKGFERFSKNHFSKFIFVLTGQKACDIKGKRAGAAAR
jgi:hypothetical protein